jgi:outer membrane immunogenic protein
MRLTSAAADGGQGAGVCAGRCTTGRASTPALTAAAHGGTSNWSNPLGGNSFNANGALIGGTAGYNWQIVQTVFGIEVDVDWSSIKGSGPTTCIVAGCETKNNWLGTFRGRIGYAFDRVMPYVTGGLAVGDLKANTAA